MRGWVPLAISGSDFRRAKAREPAGIAKLLAYSMVRRVSRFNPGPANMLIYLT